jgi:hypothetical protein
LGQALQLVSDIIDLATDSDEALSNILRKCLVLARRLKAHSLTDWALRELNGYSPDDTLPEYRIIDVQSKGHFHGGFGAEIRNQPLPLRILKPEHRDYASKAYLREPIAAYEGLLRGDLEGNLQSAWSPDLTLMYQRKFIEGYALVAAWQFIPIAAISALTDTIKTRVLTFALELESTLDSADDDPSAVSQSTVSQYVSNYIYGGNNVIAGSVQGFTQIGSISVNKGDLEQRQF